MADSQTNININIDTSQALANLKALQSQISAFQTQMARGSATQAAAAAKLRQNLINDINAAGKFNASIQNIKTTTESFTEALEKNKLSMGQYFKYAGGATKNFGKLFKTEMSTIDKVARERVKTLQTQYIQLGRDASGAMKSIAVRPLVLDMDDLGTKTAIAAQKQQILNQLLKQGSTNLLNWGKNTQWAGRQLMVGFTVPLTMAGTAAAKMYMELEKASIKFKRVYGDFNTTAKETEGMIKDIQILAQEYTKYGVAVSQTMEMAAEAAAAGKVGADLMEQVANATRLAVLGSVEQSQALETTMSLTNAFGLAAEDLAGKINFLNAVENQTVTSIEDLTVAIPKAAPVIKQLGGDVEDLAFFLTAMKEGGINASEGANALKSGIASMINPTGKANEFLQSFGINLKGIVESNKGDIKGTVIQFAQALDTLDPLNRARAIEQLFGKFQFARMSTLFQNVVKEGTQAQKVLELSNATSEELAILSERELKRVESSPMFKFQKAVEDVKVKLAPIGEAFLKAITPVIDFVGKFLDGFNKMSDGAKSFWITFTGLVAGVGPLLLMTVGLIGNGVANLIKMFVGIKSFINRTTQETGFLGESTSYMTETQIRAAAVAASLDQVHQQLTQRFTSEAAAVDALTAAYGRNITAQGAYGPMGVSPTTVGKKYANGGIISGPGTGTSDSIVAMVSNGEAIIPAKSVARNPQLIQALISGNIPGFKKGRTGFEETHMANTLPMTSEVLTQVDKLEAGFSQLSPKLKEAFVILSDLTATKSEKLNQAARAGGMTSSEFSGEWQKNAGEGFVSVADRARNAGQLGSGAEIDAAITQLDIEVGNRVANAIDNGNIDKSVKGWLDQLMADVTQTVIQEFSTSGNQARQQVGAAMAQRAATPASLRTRAVQDIIDPTTGMPYGSADAYFRAQIASGDAELRNTAGRPQVFSTNPEFTMPIGRTKSSGVLRTNSAAPSRYRGKVLGGTYENPNAPAKSDNLVFPAPGVASSYLGSGTPKMDGTDDAKQYLGARDTVLDQPNNDPYNPTRQRNSPNPLAAPDGKDDATAYLNARNETLKSSPLAPPPPPGVDAPFSAPAKSTMRDKIGAVASKIKGKGLDLVSEGIQKSKEKLTTVADGLAQSWSDSIDREIEAKNKVHAARVQLSEQLLLATDDEYLALQTQQEIYKQKLTNTNQATEAEIAEAVQREQIMQSKRTALVEEMKENGTESKVIQERARLARERGNTIDLEQANNANQASENRRGPGGGFASKMSGIMMTASMVSGALTMAGGKVGELAGAITPVLGGLSMLTMVLQQVTSRAGQFAVVGIAAIAAVVFAFMEFNNKISSGIDKVLEFNSAIGSGAKAIQNLAEFAGKVSASEILDKRRSKELNPYGVVSGKTTFGESFVDSEAGASLIKAAGQSTATVGAGGTESALFSQLATSVLSNAITPSQARSIAINIGRKMGNVSLGIKLAGQITSLLGPNGENILDNELEIRVKLIQESQRQMDLTSGNLQQNGGMNMGEVGSTVGGGALGAAGGAVAGGFALAAMAATVPVAGWVAAAVIGITTLAGAAYGAFKGAEGYAERLGKLSGANVAIQANAINQQKELLDSLQLDYEKRIDAARAAGDTARADELQNKYITDRQGLLDQNVKTMNQIEASFKNSSYQDQLLSGAEKAIGKKYKDTAMEDIAAAALSNLQANVGDKTQRYQLEMLLNTTVDPMAMLMLTDLMATDASVIDKAINISTNLTGTGLNEILGLSNLFVDPNGQLNKTVQTNFITKMSTITDGEQSQNLIELYRELGRMSGDPSINVPVIVDYVSKNPTMETKLMNDIDEIKALPKGKLSVDIVQNAKIMNPEEMAILRDDATYFNSITSREGQQIYLEYVSILSGTVESNDPGFKAWLAAEGQQYSGQGAYAQTKYVQWLAQRATTNLIGDNAFVTTPSPKTTGGSGPSASWLDDYVKGVRDLTDASQALTIGYAASGKALDAFAKKGSSFKNALAGLSNNLYSAGISQDIIDNILGMPKEEAEKEMKRFFDKNGKITQFLKSLNATAAISRIARANEAGLQSTKSIYDRVDATKALALGNKNSAVSSEMLADADMMVALAGVKLVGSLKDQKKAVDILVKSKLASLAADRLSKGAIQNEIDDAQVKIDTLEAQNNVYQNGLDIISKRAEKINEAYDKQIQALQEVKSINDEIMKQKQGELDLADALSRGDIGAAAKAAQQLRAQQAQAAADAQVKALEDAKKRAVDTLTVEINGQKFTRVDLEQKMYDISLQVLEIKKDEIVQNEVILAKQKEILNSLIAQTAEQIKKNAEAGKPITQVINKVIKTTTSSGNGNNNGGGDQKNDPTVTPIVTPTTTTPPSQKFLSKIGANRSKDLAVISEMDPKTSSDKAIKDYGNLFSQGSQKGFTNYANDSIAKRSLSADKYTEWKTWFDKYSAAENTITSMYGTNAKTVLGSVKTSARNKENMNNVATSIYNAYGAKLSGAQKTEAFNELSAELTGALNYLVNVNNTFQTNKQELTNATNTIKGYKSAYDKIDSLASMRQTWETSKGAAKKNTEYQKLIDVYGASFDSDVQKYLSSANFMKQNVSNTYAPRKALLDAKYKESDFSWIPGYFPGILTPNSAWNTDMNKILPSKIKYYSVGDIAKGTDVIPAMLTPGEFVVTQSAVKNFGVDNLRSINNGTYGGNSVYNYSVNVNVSNSGANANDIAQTVMSQIRQIDAQRIRSNNL
jgi:TP901 family phage tail tape measure protein